jgi:Rrf2 family protein
MRLVNLAMTQRTDLAVRALGILAANGTRTKSGDLAAALGTTVGMVPQVVGPLVAKGWVASVPGPTGGYESVSPLEQVSVLDVVEAVEGPVDNGRCVVAGRRCGAREQCALHDAWSRARDRMVGEMADTPLSSLPSIDAAAASSRTISSAAERPADAKRKVK